MGGMRSVLTGFVVGAVIGAGSYVAAAGIAVSPRVAVAQVKAANRIPGEVIIGNQHGGPVVDYALQMLSWREQGTSLRFTGRCDSACTLFLALPYQQTCLTAGSSFRFHAPTAETQSSAKLALAYMMHNYPDWVRSWIEERGGLSSELITMNYEYARQFMRSCGQDVPDVGKENSPEQVSTSFISR